jgi:hypothetical protein
MLFRESTSRILNSSPRASKNLQTIEAAVSKNCVRLQTGEGWSGVVWGSLSLQLHQFTARSSVEIGKFWCKGKTHWNVSSWRKFLDNILNHGKTYSHK